MSVMLGELYVALKDAGASDERATREAEEVASYEGRLSGFDSRITLLTWTVGTNIALTLAIFARLFLGTVR